MSQKFPGGFVTKSPVAPTTTAASGIWTLDQQEQYQKAGTWPSPPPPSYIEDVFSTYLYTGNGSTQTITSGLNLSGNGGLVWIKGRDNTWNNILQDTNRGVNSSLCTNNRDGAINPSGAYVSSFNSNGFSIGNNGSVNFSANTYVSWTFREQEKFFDCGTYTGNGVVRTIPHNLGSVPGCMIVKRTDVDNVEWEVYHRSLGNTKVMWLNSSDAAFTYNLWNNTDPTATEFTVSGISDINANGGTFVYYLFAHDAGGFGLSGTENVISCGSYTGNGSTTGPAVTLGYEPQWVMIKKSSDLESWYIYDSMRGVVTGAVSQADQKLRANSSGIEGGLVANDPINFGATGFNIGTTDNELNNSGDTYIYIAIRRGPMKTPTSGTSVFSPVTYTGNGSTTTGQLITTNFPVDMGINRYNCGGAGDWDVVDRLRGITGATYTTSPQSPYLNPHNTNAEALGGYIFAATNTSVKNYGFSSSFVQANYLFQRAPGFFDEVCYTGTSDSVGKTVNHNLGVVPELMIVKSRSTANSWVVYVSSLGNTSGLILNGTNAVLTGRSDFWNSTTPTSTVFSIGSTLNANTVTWVAYLFASCPGVSKVGTYTGTGALQTINCGFTSGARFVLIKRTDSTGDWYTYDSARGITSGNDPYLLLNSTAAEVTGTNYVDTDTTGFQVTAAAPAGLNASGGTYIFLAIA